jgi:hypothetical protein
MPIRRRAPARATARAARRRARPESGAPARAIRDRDRRNALAREVHAVARRLARIAAVHPPPWTKTTPGVGPLDTERPVEVMAQRLAAGLAVDHVGRELVGCGTPGNERDLAGKRHARRLPQAAECWNIAPPAGSVEDVRPLIGITSYARGGTRLSFAVPCEYVDAIRRAGGVPVVLPPCSGRCARRWTSCRADLPRRRRHPSEHYGGHDHGTRTIAAPAPRARRVELVMAGRRLDRDMPIMCVCRGHAGPGTSRSAATLISRIPDLYRHAGDPSHPRKFAGDHAPGTDRSDEVTWRASTATRRPRCEIEEFASPGHVKPARRRPRAASWAEDGVVSERSKSNKLTASSSRCSGTRRLDVCKDESRFTLFDKP